MRSQSPAATIGNIASFPFIPSVVQTRPPCCLALPDALGPDETWGSGDLKPGCQATTGLHLRHVWLLILIAKGSCTRGDKSQARPTSFLLMGHERSRHVASKPAAAQAGQAAVARRVYVIRGFLLPRARRPPAMGRGVTMGTRAAWALKVVCWEGTMRSLREGTSAASQDDA
ncbi:hypothetical protein CPLU01_09158 [Colletotrichum plurivorum]|uniref:Uncharacterized protein n=1 Tax=Colletotrichum plurivorum TaxID=2175906 RepID=A0A8H6NBG2_9PEZI|nr:hypothetical protein CPLU01_09158 [Colletotrichum plurivorum]